MNWVVRPWRQAFDYSGRATRREYGIFVLVFYGALFAMGALLGAVSAVAGLEDSQLATIPVIVFALGSMLVSLSLTVRRLHDHDKTGWFILLWFVPFIGWIFFLIMILTPGTDGWNSYGADPRDPDARAEDVAGIFS